jgi:hypothetical protein
VSGEKTLRTRWTRRGLHCGAADICVIAVCAASASADNGTTRATRPEHASVLNSCNSFASAGYTASGLGLMRLATLGTSRPLTRIQRLSSGGRSQPVPTLTLIQQ